MPEKTLPISVNELTQPNLLLEKAQFNEIFSPDKPLAFLPDSNYHTYPQIHLAEPDGRSLFDQQALDSGIDGFKLVFSQSSAGNMNVGFDCLSGKNIDSVQLLCQTTTPDGKVTAGWTENLIEADSHPRLVSNREITFNAAINKVVTTEPHPTIIFKVKRGMKQEQVMVNSKWIGTANNWTIKAEILKGMLVRQLNQS